MDIVFETNLKEEEEQLVEEYYNIKKQLSELVKKEELLKDNIKKIMGISNLRNINTNKIDFILRESERVFYPKLEVEKNVPQEILDKIRKIQKLTILISKIKNSND